MTYAPEISEGVQHNLFLAEGDAFIKYYSLEHFSWKNKDQAYLSLRFLLRFHELKCRALTSPYLLNDLWSRIESALTRSNSLRVLAPGFALDKEHIATVVFLNTATLSDTLAHGGWNNGDQWISDTSVYFAMVDLIRSNLTKQPPRSLRVVFCNPDFWIEDGRILSALGAEVVRARHLEETYDFKQDWKADTLFYDEQTQTMWLGRYIGSDGDHPHSGRPSGSGSAPPPPPPPAPAPAPASMYTPASLPPPPIGFLKGSLRFEPQTNPDFNFGNLPKYRPVTDNSTSTSNSKTNIQANKAPTWSFNNPTKDKVPATTAAVPNLFGQPSGPFNHPQQPNKTSTGGNIFGIVDGGFPKPITAENPPAGSAFGQPSGGPAAATTIPSLFATKPANGQANNNTSFSLFNKPGPTALEASMAQFEANKQQQQQQQQQQTPKPAQSNLVSAIKTNTGNAQNVRAKKHVAFVDDDDVEL